MRQQFEGDACASKREPCEKERGRSPKNTKFTSNTKTLRNSRFLILFAGFFDLVRRDDFLSFCMTFFGDSIEKFASIHVDVRWLPFLAFYTYFLHFFIHSLKPKSLKAFVQMQRTSCWALATLVVGLFIICFHLAASVVCNSFSKI